MFYEVSKEVFDKLPNFVVGVVAVTGINNAKEYPAIQKTTVQRETKLWKVLLTSLPARLPRQEEIPHWSL